VNKAEPPALALRRRASGSRGGGWRLRLWLCVVYRRAARMAAAVTEFVPRHSRGPLTEFLNSGLSSTIPIDWPENQVFSVSWS